MKRYNNLWDEMIKYETLLKSFHKAKRRKNNFYHVMKYKFNLESNLFELKHRLENKTWLPGPERIFTEYGVKIREIHAPYFEDRIVHHALISVINPIYEKLFTWGSFACREGKGNINAMKALHSKIKHLNHSNKNNFYFLKADIKKYFENINHDILISIIKRKIKDKNIVDLFEKIIRRNNKIKGLPIRCINITTKCKYLFKWIRYIYQTKIKMQTLYTIHGWFCHSKQIKRIIKGNLYPNRKFPS